MKYTAINEITNFSYRDSYITEADFNGDKIVFQVEALIVRAKNSQNTNFTDSYADATKVEFNDANIIKLLKLGYKYYDANDNLIDEIPDTEEAFSAINLKALFEKSFITDVIETADNSYAIRIELPELEPGVITNEYELQIKCSDIVYSWDKYLNRVQEY